MKNGRNGKIVTNQWSAIVYIATLLIFCVGIFLNGCTLKRSGKADVTYFSIKASEGLVGLTKSEVIEKMGLPDGTVTDERNIEYWTYVNERLYHFLLLGRGRKRNLILQFNENLVTTVDLQDAGASWNFSLPTLIIP
jgi:hypothetical protein